MKEHPKSGVPVLILLKDGTVHTGHFLKNANYKVTNINKWRLYGNKQKGKIIDDEEVADWISLELVAMNWDYLADEQQKFICMLADIVGHKLINIAKSQEVENEQ